MTCFCGLTGRILLLKSFHLSNSIDESYCLILSFPNTFPGKLKLNAKGKNTKMKSDQLSIAIYIVPSRF